MDQPESITHALSKTDKPARFGRRRLLLWAGGAAALATVGGVGRWLFWDQIWGPRVAGMREHRVKLPVGAPTLVIARGPDPTRNVSAALSHFGGMRQFVSRGECVLIKPNIGWSRVPAQAANTHPAVVAALVTACREAGAGEVWVTDVPVHDPKSAFERSGIYRAAADAGAKVILPEHSRYIQIPIPGRTGTWPLLELLVKADRLINVPAVKAHSLSRISAGMKNWLGVLGSQRVLLHTNIDAALASLAELMRPTLTVVDATRVLMQGQPAGGNLADVKQVGAVAVSVDPVAADSWAASAVDLDPAAIRYLALAEQRQLGHANWKAVAPVELVSS